MISLNQILLLEQKIESAVEKIKRLQAENDALRKSCAELTNALSVKSEQLSKFEQEQGQIESGIKNALEKLTAIENSVIEATSQAPQNNIPQDTIPSSSQENQNEYSVPQDTAPQEDPRFYEEENISQEEQSFAEQPNEQNDTTSSPFKQDTSEQDAGEQEEPFVSSLASTNESYEESSVEENTSYKQEDQDIENSFDEGGSLFPLTEDMESDDTGIDDFYDEQESPENDISNNEQDTSTIEIF